MLFVEMEYMECSRELRGLIHQLSLNCWNARFFPQKSNIIINKQGNFIFFLCFKNIWNVSNAYLHHLMQVKNERLKPLAQTWRAYFCFPKAIKITLNTQITHEADWLQYHTFLKQQGAINAEIEEQREKHTPVCENIRVRRLPSKRSEFHNWDKTPQIVNFLFLIFTMNHSRQIKQLSTLNN